MRHGNAWWSMSVIFGVTFTGIGCETPQSRIASVPLVEEFRVAPDEARFNNAPERGYVPPAPKEEFKPGFGAGGGPGGGGGGAGGGMMSGGPGSYGGRR